MGKQYLGIDTVQAILNVSRRRVLDWIKNGELYAIRNANYASITNPEGYFIHKDDYTDFIKTHEKYDVFENNIRHWRDKLV